jgi:hypothetical protein
MYVFFVYRVGVPITSSLITIVSKFRLLCVNKLFSVLIVSYFIHTKPLL